MKKSNKKYLVIGFLFVIFSLSFIIGFSWSYVNAKSVYPLDTFFTGIFRSVRVKYCTIRDFLPDRYCTPGSLEKIDPSKICKETAKRAYINEKLRRQIFNNYQIDYPPKEQYELDHYLPNWMGGDETELNLWPQASPNYQLKDRLEYLLYRRYCLKIITLEQARNEMIDWRNSYKKYFEDKLLGSFNYYMRDFQQEEFGNP